MTLNAVLVVNGNDKQCDNVRRSVTHAAVRWNCDYWEYRAGSIVPDYFPSYEKFLAPLLPHPWSRLLVLDADIMVHCHAPSPFEVLSNRHCVYGVPDCQSERFTTEVKHRVRDFVHGRWLAPVTEQLGISIEAQDYFKQMWNSGVTLWSFPEHLPALEQFKAWLPNVHWQKHEGHVEQVLINLALMHTKTPVVNADEKWNMLSPLATGPMQGYFYHFTGVEGNIHKIRQPTFPWWI